jgi:hypothetical protein
MKKINIHKLYYHIRFRYFTLNNLVIGVALIIGAGWTWGSVGMMQRNFDLQKEVDAKARQQTLLELQTQNLAYEQRYYKSLEYQEFALRDRMGLARKGEKALVLPPNSKEAKAADARLANKPSAQAEPVGNVEQWMNFLFGGNRRK